MKKWILQAVLMAGMTMIAVGQQAQSGIPAALPRTQAANPDLPRFDLDFPGGSPRDFVRALNEPLKGSLNVILPGDVDDIEIPPIKLKQVTVQQVFDAIQRASERTVSFPNMGGGISQQTENYMFMTSGAVTENSVWAFRAFRPITASQSMTQGYRFYQLGSYLDAMKIEDIITALQTGWEMLNKQGAKLKFHPETKLLIAVGQPSDFALIDDVLKELAKAPRLMVVLFNGEVRTPGPVALPRDRKLTFSEAVDRAGGFTPDADTNRIRLVRPGASVRILSEAKAGQIPIEPGDEIIVNRKE